jgi:aspartate/methionine/tyrosine aminotransferase
VRIRKVVIEKADRLYQLPPDPMAYLQSERRRTLPRRITTLDLATFNWPIAFDNGAVPSAGLVPASEAELAGVKEEIAAWFQSNHGTKIDPDKEIFVGGSVSTLLYLAALAFVDSGDLVFVPSLGVPHYRRVTGAVGGEALRYEISAKNNWLPSFDRITSRAGRVARVLFLNSPHNPTGAELDTRIMSDLVWLAGKENVLLVNDASHSALSGHRTVSLMSISDGKQVGIELYSIPRTFGIPSIPLGFAIGNKDAIAGLKAAIQVVPQVIYSWMISMAREAIHSRTDRLDPVRRQIAQSRAAIISLCETLELEPAGYQTIPFLWAKIDGRRPSSALAATLFRRSRVLVTPGSAFGDNGEGHIRFSLTAEPDVIESARQRIAKKLTLLKLVERS